MFKRIAFLTVVTAGLAATAQAELPPQTVGTVDLQAYQGLWHEIASIPASFQRKCVRDTTAEYRLAEHGEIQVINRCRKKDGEIQEATGRARINPDFEDPSKLEVTFLKIFDWAWFASGDYWILELDEQKVSLVGSPDRKYAWILAREPSLPLKTLQELEETLVRNGFDPCALRLSRTVEQDFAERPKLCDVTAK